MKERPILFSAPMVRALLAGTKTQTRRVARTENTMGRVSILALRQGKKHAPVYLLPEHKAEAAACCPYGQPGDRLWVRETWQVARETLDYETGGEYDVWEWPDELGDPRPHLRGDARFGTKAGLFYAADGEDKNPGVFYDLIGIDNKTILRQKEINWRPSIHMPRWASRILLEVTSVRVERLQDISEADAMAEGTTPIPDPCDHVRLSCAEIGCSGPQPYRVGFRALWQDINGPDSWAANPWVWAIEFRRLP